MLEAAVAGKKTSIQDLSAQNLMKLRRDQQRTNHAILFQELMPSEIPENEQLDQFESRREPSVELPLQERNGTALESLQLDSTSSDSTIRVRPTRKLVRGSGSAKARKQAAIMLRRSRVTVKDSTKKGSLATAATSSRDISDQTAIDVLQLNGNEFPFLPTVPSANLRAGTFQNEVNELNEEYNQKLRDSIRRRFGVISERKRMFEEMLGEEEVDGREDRLVAKADKILKKAIQDYSKLEKQVATRGLGTMFRKVN